MYDAGALAAAGLSLRAVALMLLQHSRRDARISHGQLVLLSDQDRGCWHWNEIEEARALLALPELRQPMTARAAAYVLQAHIAAEHAAAASASDTNWGRIVSLYDRLLDIAPSPAAQLARAVAVAEYSGARAGLLALEAVDMPGSHRPDSVRAELLARTGDLVAARAAYDQAITGCLNEVELSHLARRRAALT